MSDQPTFITRAQLSEALKPLLDLLGTDDMHVGTRILITGEAVAYEAFTDDDGGRLIGRPAFVQVEVFN